MWPIACCFANSDEQEAECTVTCMRENADSTVAGERKPYPSLLSSMIPRQAEVKDVPPATKPVVSEADAFPAKTAVAAYLREQVMEAPEQDVDACRGFQSESTEQDEVELFISQRVMEAKRTWLSQQQVIDRARRTRELEAMIEESRLQAKQHSSALLFGGAHSASRYGNDAQLPTFDRLRHVPVLGLINPRSGAGSGEDILKAARDTPYYQDRFFNIIDVVKGKKPGGLLDVFRQELIAVKEESKKLKVRPRLVSGGGDGTASFALFIVFSALKADNLRPEPELHDTGNGFVWTDEELRDYFPALAQMPLGSANDFAHTLGWGQKYPGDPAGNVFATRSSALLALRRWISAVISPDSRVVNFDLWGIMPKPGAEQVDFKICELTGKRGFNPKTKSDAGEEHLMMKVAGSPVPFFVCLYFSTGFAAYMVARFQINRRSHPLTNKLEYCRQALGIASERTPPQLEVRLDKVRIDCGDEPYFPPRRGDDKAGQRYREVGFFNINWQANLVHGADRAPALTRMLSQVREPAKFNDGHLDMYRMKFRSLIKNPGLKFQTDKREEMTLSFDSGKGKGMFFQWDGEARFAFSLTGEQFDIHIRKVLNVPVVLGPFYDDKIAGDPDNGKPVVFEFAGKDAEAKDAVRRRVLKYVEGELEAEMNATQEEISGAGMARYPHFDI